MGNETSEAGTLHCDVCATEFAPNRLKKNICSIFCSVAITRFKGNREAASQWYKNGQAINQAFNRFVGVNPGSPKQ